jgi:large subunit ribosomal protein L23
MSKTIDLKPRLNEKTYTLSANQVYVFDVDKSVNKHTVARAVEAQFEVKVVSVNTTNINGKAKRIISLNGKRSKNANGKRNDFKKAYVTLVKGDSLPFFNAVEESEQKEQAIQEKVDKAAAKEADKAAAPAKRGLRLRAKKDKATEEEDKE